MRSPYNPRASYNLAHRVLRKKKRHSMMYVEEDPSPSIKPTKIKYQLWVPQTKVGRRNPNRGRISIMDSQQKMSGDGIPTEFEYELCVPHTIF